MRDALLGIEPKDFDVATDATPDRVREIFGRRKTLAFGASFGVIGVLPPSRQDAPDGEVKPTEVATFRSDGEYSDGRRPDRVHFGDARNDALRRDFTINGLFFDPAEERVIDFVGGQEDLAARRLRTIGRPCERFDEDKLRMLRAIRFATTLGFELDAETETELKARVEQISMVSVERVGAEMRRIVSSNFAPRGFELLRSSELDRHIMADLHLAKPTLLTHWLSHRVSLDFESSLALVVLAMFQNDRAPNANALVKRLTRHWRLSNEESRRCLAAVNLWETVALANKSPWSIVQPVLINRDIQSIMDVAKARIFADQLDSGGIDKCTAALDGPAELLDPPPLISGDSLQKAGYAAGPQFRQWLSEIRAMQLDGKLSTQAEALSYIAGLSESEP